MPHTHSDIDGYLASRLLASDPVLDAVLAASAAAGLPEIQVSAAQGKQLMLLARAIGAARILEIGTLGGYSTVWLARGLGPGGAVVTLEMESKHVEVARRNLDEAGMRDRVEIIEGPAIETLDELERRGVPPFDLTFIDADKQNLVPYFERVVRLSRPGAVIIADNVIRKGEVADETNTDPRVLGARGLLDHVKSRDDVSAIAIQTVGEKGHDGYLFAIVGTA